MEKISYSFLGTFSMDRIPMFKDENFLINVDLSKKWKRSAFYWNIIFKHAIVYFDSYGVETTNLTVGKYL